MNDVTRRNTKILTSTPKGCGSTHRCDGMVAENIHNLLVSIIRLISAAKIAIKLFILSLFSTFL